MAYIIRPPFGFHLNMKLKKTRLVRYSGKARNLPWDTPFKHWLPPLEPRGPGGAAGEVRGGGHQGEALWEGEEGQVVHQECRHIQGQYFIAKYLGNFFIFLLILDCCLKTAYDFGDWQNIYVPYSLFFMFITLNSCSYEQICTERKYLSS